MSRQLATGRKMSRVLEKPVTVLEKPVTVTGVFFFCIVPTAVLDTWKTHKDFPKLQSLDHVVFSMAEVVGRIDESFLPPGIIDLPSTLEQYAGMKEMPVAFFGPGTFSEGNVMFRVLRQMRKVWRADKVFN